MTVLAVVSGGAALGMVLLLGALGRRPMRRLPPQGHDARPPPRRRRPAREVPLLAGALVTGVAAAAVGPVPVALAVGLVLLALRRRTHRGAAIRRRAVEAAMPDAIELLVLCMHAGCSPTQAVVALAARAPPALRPAFAGIELQLHRGRSLAEALGALADVGGAVGRDVASGIAAADRDGLPLAPLLDRLATEARAARRRIGEADARRLPVRLTFPLVTCTLPAFVLLAIAPAVIGAISTLRANAP